MYQEVSEAQMYVFHTTIPTFMKNITTEMNSEILRKVDKGGIRRITEDIKLSRANLVGKYGQN